MDDRVTRLARDLASGKVHLTPSADGPLPGLLHALGVNPDSQTLVFSKTSFQAARIEPHNPRALYFSDDVMVGFVRGSDLLELAALDPKQGVVFYSFNGASNPPSFDRRDACLQCHTSPGTLGVPGLLIASSYTDASGMPAFRGGQRITDDRTRTAGEDGTSQARMRTCATSETPWGTIQPIRRCWTCTIRRTSPAWRKNSTPAAI